MQNEIKLLRSVDHKNLIKLDSVFETKNSYYLIFELFSGGNLREYVKEKGVFTESQASFVLKNILEGVKYLHNKNIMHRDIKPDNILFRTSNIFSDNNQIVLADFGLATSNDVPQYLYPKCGTPGFVAPEIYAVTHFTDHYGLNCDLYSIGVTLYFMLTGNFPYPGKADLINENQNNLIDFNKSSIFKTLSKQGNCFHLFYI